MKRAICLAQMVLVFLAMASFALASDPAVRITGKDNKTSFSLQVNRYLTVALRADPASGCQWLIKSINPDVLRSRKKPEFVPYGDAGSRLGDFVFEFVGVAPGRLDLEFVYQRPFEEPVNQFSVKVVVKP